MSCSMPAARRARSPCRRSRRLVSSSHPRGARGQRCIASASTASSKSPIPPRASIPRTREGPSAVVDPCAFDWPDGSWRGRPWHEAVIYELHVGTFSRRRHLRRHRAAPRAPRRARRHGRSSSCRSRTFRASAAGATTACCRTRPTPPTARPESSKALIAAAHAQGLAVMLDVVYNHFGPEGNYLHRYAPDFFTDRHHTPWGAAINFDGPDSRTVRDFFIAQRALLARGVSLRRPALRCRARHRSMTAPVHFFTEIARARARSRGTRAADLPRARESTPTRLTYLGAPGAPATHDAQWNDDVHHCLHVILTGETDGYYADLRASARMRFSCRALAQGFAYQGEAFGLSRAAERRGEQSAHLPPTAFVPFLQNHDQIGNRAHGERLTAARQQDAVRAARGDRACCSSPRSRRCSSWARNGERSSRFPYFCDMSADLTVKIREGRRQEFARFGKFGAAHDLPDPAVRRTPLQAARLDWSQAQQRARMRTGSRSIGACSRSATATSCRSSRASAPASARSSRSRAGPSPSTGPLADGAALQVHREPVRRACGAADRQLAPPVG